MGKKYYTSELENYILIFFSKHESELSLQEVNQASYTSAGNMVCKTFSFPKISKSFIQTRGQSIDSLDTQVRSRS